MKEKPEFSKDLIRLNNLDEVVSKITTRLKNDIFHVLKRNGAVIGISGGIDSSVTLALTAKTIDPGKIIGVILPESDSNPDSKLLALELADKYGIRTIEESITGALEGFGCYRRRDDAVKSVFPEYNPEHDKFKIEIKQQMHNVKLPPLFYLTVYFAGGEVKSKILPLKAYLQIVASTNFKQRSRMAMLYYHAESNHYAVVGTPNKHEVRQGFFVKYGDGGADVMPIGHLYKSQVYQLAEYLEVPRTIIDRTPTTDTYPAEQTQEDFFYQLPFEAMDVLWYGWENDYSVNEVAKETGYTVEEITNIFTGFERKIKTTDYLRMSPIHYF